MDSQDIRNLQEAYMEVCDEAYKRFPYNKVEYKIHKKEADNPTGRGTPQSVKIDKVFRHFKREVLPTEKREYSPKISKAKEAENRERGTQKEQVDLYDIILSHLLDEGYAETPEAAEVIMGNMSEEWREDIVEGMSMKDFKANRRKLQRKEARDDAKKRGHVDKFTGKPYSTAEAASRRKDIHKPEKAPEREARRRFEENPD